VVNAIIEEYTDELLFCPTTEQGWRDLADKWYQRWNFPHTVGAIDGKHVACKAPPNSGSEFYRMLPLHLQLSTSFVYVA